MKRGTSMRAAQRELTTSIMPQELYDQFKNEMDERKYDGWNNFGKRDLNEYEKGFNDAVEYTLSKLKTMIV